MDPINRAISAIKKYQNPASPLELEPAIITDSPTGKGRIKMLRKQLKEAKKQHRTIKRDLSKHDYIIDQQLADGFADRIFNVDSKHTLKQKLKQAKDDYRSKNFLGIGDGSGNALPSQLYRYWSRHFGYQKNQDPTFSSKGTDIIDLSNNVIRLTPESEQSTALFNEFVEKGRPSVHQAKEYQSGNVKRFGDKANIPVENISLYAGVEDGKFKVDSLKQFDPQTVIYPARNVKRNTPKIHGIQVEDVQNNRKDLNVDLIYRLLGKMPHDRWSVANITLQHPESNPYLFSQYQDHANFVLNNIPESLSKHESEELKRIVKGKRPSWLPTSLHRILMPVTSTEMSNPQTIVLDSSKIDNAINSGSAINKYIYIDSEGNKHPIQDYNAAILDTKMVLGNPEGGVFIGKFQDISPEQLDSLNNYLSKNPSWLVRPDLGSFNQYRLDNPSLKDYLKQYFEHPKEDDPNVYTVGTTTPNKLW